MDSVLLAKGSHSMGEGTEEEYRQLCSEGWRLRLWKCPELPEFLHSSQKCHWRTEGGRREDGVFCSAALFRRSDVPKRLVQCRLWNMTPTPDFYRKESMCTAVPSLEYLFIDQCRSFSRNFVNEIRKILRIIKPLQKDLNYSESSFQRFQDQMTCVF